MEDEVKLEGISLYLENLLPGIVILGGILALLPQPQQNAGFLLNEIIKSEFLLVAFLLSVAYMLGLISAVISRMFVNSLISEKITRPLMLMISHERLMPPLRPPFPFQKKKAGVKDGIKCIERLWHIKWLMATQKLR
jgi:hypothetical protein